MITWHFVTKAMYDAADAAVKTADKLFFISDTRQIMRGTQNFSESVELFTGSNPSNPAIGKLYINSSTLEGKVFNGTAWATVIKPIETSDEIITDSAKDQTAPVNSKAVIAYIARNIDSTLQISGAAADAKATGDALSNKQDLLTFDLLPIDGSLNPVTSDGIYDAIAAINTRLNDFDSRLTALEQMIKPTMTLGTGILGVATLG